MYKRLEELLKEHHISAYRLAQETGISTATLTSWKQGKYAPKQDKLQKIADYFGVQVEWLTGATDFKTKEDLFRSIDSSVDLEQIRSQMLEYDPGVVQIPVRGEVAAGEPIFAQERYIGYEDISKDMAKRGNLFGLVIKGDSMSPRIARGDTVIVRQQDDAESGDIVIVLINGDTATCKRLVKYSEGISLISFNPEYAPMNFSNEEIISKPVKIIGKVIENRQRY